jgi:FtsZ-binding cell division protein ZapB
VSVSDTSQLPRLDAILYDRPSGRNTVGHAIDTIHRLRHTIHRLRQENTALRDTNTALRDITAMLEPANFSLKAAWDHEKERADRAEAENAKRKAGLKSLLDRVRPNSEAPAWVVDELRAIFSGVVSDRA